MNKHKLYAPKEFWALPEEERQGRCGHGEGIGERLVPDHILGLKITLACSIHDYMWGVAETYEDMKEANRVFFLNMARLIKNGNRWMVPLRIPIALGYWALVSGPSATLLFWLDHNKSENLG